MKAVPFLIAVLFLAISALGQTPAPVTPAPAPAPTSTFSLITQAVALPGGKQTVAANITGGTFNFTPNFSLRNDNLFAPGNELSGYFGGAQYALPWLGTKLNNLSPNVDGNHFQFYVTASAGVDRIAVAGADTKQHWAFLAGGGANYSPEGNRVFSVNLFELRYAKLPGYANNTWLFSSGVKLNF